MRNKQKEIEGWGCRILFFLHFVLLFCVVNLFSQGPDTLWTKTYGGVEWDFGESVQQTSDGGYIIVGCTESFGSGWEDVYLIKTDSMGDTVWTKTYGETSTDYGLSVQETFDNGYIIAGYTSSFGTGGDTYLIKTNSNGDTIWTKTYGGANIDEAISVQQTSDGGYIIAGYTESFGLGDLDVYIIKTYPNGDTLWTRTYGGTEYDKSSSIQQTCDGGYIAAGVTLSFGAGWADVYLIKTDALGDTLWTKTYGGVSHDWGMSVQQTSDSGYIIVGGTGSYGKGDGNVYLIKTDPKGDTLWTKVYGGESFDEGYSVQQTSDGGYIVAGLTQSFGAGENDFYLIKTDEVGNLLWSNTYGDSVDDWGISVRETSDSCFIVAGFTSSFGAGGYDVYLIKIESDVGIKEYKVVNLKEDIPFIEVSPNPLSDKTIISIQCSVPSHKKEITLSLYDLSGRLVKSFSLNTNHSSLTTTVSWDGKDNSGKKVPCGLYFLEFEVGKYNTTRKLLKIR